MGKALGAAAYDVQYCLPLWSAIVTFAMAIPLNQARSLSGLEFLAYVNSTSIVVALFISCGFLYSYGAPPLDDYYAQGGANAGDPDVQYYKVGTTGLIADDITFLSFFSAVSKILFAYTGQLLYFEIIAEMVKPEDFPKAFLVSGPYQVGMYTLVSTTGYAYLGSEISGFIIDVIPFSLCNLMWLSFSLSVRVCSCVFFYFVLTRSLNNNSLSLSLSLSLPERATNEQVTPSASPRSSSFFKS